MHSFWVDGIFNLVVYLLFEQLVQQGRRMHATFSIFLLSWTWPAKFKVKADYMASIFCVGRMNSSWKAKHIE